jgi:hypothetical protein
MTWLLRKTLGPIYHSYFFELAAEIRSVLKAIKIYMGVQFKIIEKLNVINPHKAQHYSSICHAGSSLRARNAFVRVQEGRV